MLRQMVTMNSLNSPPPSTPLSGVPSGLMNSTRNTSRSWPLSVSPSNAAKPSSTRKLRRIWCLCIAYCDQGPRVSRLCSWSAWMTFCRSATRSAKGNTCGISSSTASSARSAPGAEACEDALAASSMTLCGAPRCSPEPTSPASSTSMWSSSWVVAPLSDAASRGLSAPKSTTGARLINSLDSGMTQGFSPCRIGRRQCRLYKRLTRDLRLDRKALAAGASWLASGIVVTKW
mmetsp:Transcript_31013/g.72017  ORF Transcript_31013/g.72017 Transcript_31013/m.72017 type:complete len:232 (-) Transcript_31013:546-1241(-)